jgi:alkylated DNA repair dioxygenase AlkB
MRNGKPQTTNFLMPQLPLFSDSPERRDIPLRDGELSYWPRFYALDTATDLFAHLQTDIEWRAEEIVMFGKKVMQPRLTAWYGDDGTAYTYAGLTMEPLPWTALLLRIRDDIELATGHHFNSVLLNLYRHGQDSMGWHSDDEPALGVNPAIASLSLGQARRFHLRHRQDHQLKQHLELTHGSLLLMAGALQHHWQHQLPKSQRPMSPRINLTFRYIHLDGRGG